jgi:6-phosphogluconate dehydrogenase
MELAMIGLGRMGGNMVRRLRKGGHRVVVYDRDPAAIAELAAVGVVAAKDPADLCAQLAPPRVVWIMVPAGPPVDATIQQLLPHLTKGDVVVDGGNSNFHDTVRRAEALAGKSLELVDAGTSGGIWGLEAGYCLMVGGSAGAVERCRPLFETLAPAHGFAHVGPTGAGHYVKMVHNGIEYGLLEAFAEGYALLHATKRFPLDLHQIAAVWNHGSVIRSWINELAERAFGRDSGLADIKGAVADSGEGRWTVQEALDLNVPAPVITLSLLARLQSRERESFGAKLIAALRHEFGGHPVLHE